VNRRRRFWVIVAVVVGAALVVLGRPDGDAESGLPEQRPVVPVSPSPTTFRPEAPHEASGVVGDEELDPSAAAGARQAAEQFAEIWAAPDPRWYDRLAGLATPVLAASLADAEPPPEPGYRITGDAEVHFGAPEWARVGVPTAGGVVVLDVVVVDGHWLVSAVDWRPS
jgi:hypothetical protein